MCLAVPGKIVETYEKGGLQMKVDFGGCSGSLFELCSDMKVGEYCIIHVGFAISL
jgi:hydrogenase expression/formation protein HypC